MRLRHWLIILCGLTIHLVAAGVALVIVAGGGLTIGGVTWAAYTALLAYHVGSAIEDFPIASVLISGAITTAIIAAIFLVARRRHTAPDSG